jgi:hypothetical protein
MNELNEIAKRSAAERLKKAMEMEKVGPSETGRKLGILDTYISMMKTEKFWPKMPKSAWDRIMHWCNSGETIHHYKLPIELPPKEISRKPAEIKPIENIAEPMIRVKPEALEKRRKELAERDKVALGMSKGTLIDLLLQEKELLKSKIEAIDLLLKHYIS